MRAIDMIQAKLVEIGADGLYNQYMECGCKVGDLIPCSMDCGECVAARNDEKLAKENDSDFWMVPIEE